MRDGALTLLLGLAMGLALSRIGFSSWDEVHAMFTFSSLRMFLAFCGAVVLLALTWPLITRLASSRSHYRHRPLHRGSIAGGIVFGVGWALSGACPSIAMVQLGEGQLAAGWTVLGIFAGNWLYSAMHVRYLRWDVGSCVDE